MKRAFLVLILLIVGGGVAGAAFLAFYPLPAPTQRMEIAVPNDKLGN